MAWMLAVIVVVGPLDYLLVHRVLRRPHATWFTLPVCMIAAAALGARSAQSWNTSAARSNQPVRPPPIGCTATEVRNVAVGPLAPPP